MLYEVCITDKNKVFEKMIFDNGYTYIKRDLSFNEYLKIIFNCVHVNNKKTIYV